jgi:hypothetical protein
VVREVGANRFGSRGPSPRSGNSSFRRPVDSTPPRSSRLRRDSKASSSRETEQAFNKSAASQPIPRLSDQAPDGNSATSIATTARSRISGNRFWRGTIARTCRARGGWGNLLVDRAALVSKSAYRPVLAPDLAGTVVYARVDPTLEGRALQDALRAAIAPRAANARGTSTTQAGWRRCILQKKRSSTARRSGKHRPGVWCG